MTHDPQLAVRNRRTALLVLGGMFAVHALALGLALYWAVQAGHPHDSQQALDPPAGAPVLARAQRTVAPQWSDARQPPPPTAPAVQRVSAAPPLPDWLSRTSHRDPPAPWHHDAPGAPGRASRP